MNWQTVPLGDLAEFRNGINYDKTSFGEGLKVIGVANFQDYTKPRYKELNEIKPEGVVKDEDMLQDQDILFVRSNGNKELIGRSMFIDSPLEPVTFSGFSIRARFKTSDAVPRFYAYLFRSDIIRKTLTSHGGGTNIANLNQRILSRLEVPFPPRFTQQRIADILTAYDDFIDNNTRRIALLEESIHRLYKEWFVYLRFPGCDRVKVVDSVPEGWRKGVASEVMKILSGGTPKTNVADYWDGKIPFFTPKDASDSIYSTDTEKNITEKGLNNCNSRLFPRHTVFITARGTVGKLAIAQREMALNQSCYALQGRENISQLFLYVAMKFSIEYFRQAATGGVFDTIIVKTFDGIPFMIPSAEITKMFEEFVNPLFSMIENLLLTNRKLREARDLLLPRLMNRSIAV